MKNNKIKEEGFTLLEVIISIALISILSVGIYSGYMIIIKHTKAGQVKQETALEGKKIIEEMQSINFKIPSSTDNKLKIGKNIELTKEGESTTAFIRYLDENYNNVTEDSAKFVEKITLTPTKTVNTNQSIELNTNDVNSEADKIYISKIDSKDYIYYWKYSKDNPYTPNTNEDTEIPSSGESVSGVKKIELSVYLNTVTNLNNQNIEIKDYKGQSLLTATKDKDENLVVNFSKYKESDGSVPTDVEIEINVYNNTSTITNIYIEKQKNLNANVVIRRGKIDVYDNRSEDASQGNIGTLYDIKVEISDYTKYKNNEINEDNDNLFTGYSKKNIH